jgi:hypothetical protein
VDGTLADSARQIAEGSANVLNRLVNRIPAHAISRQVGFVLMWLGRGAALLTAIVALGIWLSEDAGWWGPRFARIMALLLAALCLPPALMVAATGKRAYLGRGDWRRLAILLALWVVLLAVAFASIAEFPLWLRGEGNQ